MLHASHYFSYNWCFGRAYDYILYFIMYLVEKTWMCLPTYYKKDISIFFNNLSDFQAINFIIFISYFQYFLALLFQYVINFITMF